MESLGLSKGGQCYAVLEGKTGPNQARMASLEGIQQTQLMVARVPRGEPVDDRNTALGAVAPPTGAQAPGQVLPGPAQPQIPAPPQAQGVTLFRTNGNIHTRANTTMGLPDDAVVKQAETQKAQMQGAEKKMAQGEMKFHWQSQILQATHCQEQITMNQEMIYENHLAQHELQLQRQTVTMQAEHMKHNWP